MKLILPALSALLISLIACSALAENKQLKTINYPIVYSTIYWSDGDSGKLGDLKFRLANIDAPETGSLKQRGGAKCEAERELGYEAKAYMVWLSNGKQIEIIRNYDKDKYGRLVVDLTANGIDIATAAVEAGHLKPWPHKKGRALSPKPNWCEN